MLKCTILSVAVLLAGSVCHAAQFKCLASSGQQPGLTLSEDGKEVLQIATPAPISHLMVKSNEFGAGGVRVIKGEVIAPLSCPGDCGITTFTLTILPAAGVSNGRLVIMNKRFDESSGDYKYTKSESLYKCVPET